MLLTLGEAQAAAGRADEARPTLERAARDLEATVGPSHLDTVRAQALLAQSR